MCMGDVSCSSVDEEVHIVNSEQVLKIWFTNRNPRGITDRYMN